MCQALYRHVPTLRVQPRLTDPDTNQAIRLVEESMSRVRGQPNCVGCRRDAGKGSQEDQNCVQQNKSF
jgi:hypothetical protein